MNTKWQTKWNYYGWKEYLDVIPDRPSMQGDWNNTLLTKINFIKSNIISTSDRPNIGISVNSKVFDMAINGLPFSGVKDGITYIGRMSVNIDETLADDKVYVYDKNNEENIGEITIDFVSETRD